MERHPYLEYAERSLRAERVERMVRERRAQFEFEADTELRELHRERGRVICHHIAARRAQQEQIALEHVEAIFGRVELALDLLEPRQR